MRIAVISDSHDRLDKLETFLKVCEEEQFDLVVHCGDFVSPFTVKLLLSNLKSDFIGVFGNNDGEVYGLIAVSGGTLEKPPVRKVLDNQRFAIMHEPLFIEQLALSGDFDFILYGHTHQVDTRVIGSCQIVNPGELCGYITGKTTFAILDTVQNSVEIREV